MTVTDCKIIIFQDAAENAWTWANKFIELDLDKKAEGVDLDEFNAHRFLESMGETKTVRQMRKEIAEADMDFNKRLSLLEYCLWKHKYNVKAFNDKPQGDNQEELKKAMALLEEVMSAFNAVDARAKEAKEAEAQAKQREAEAVEAERPFKIAQEELNAALAELHAQEEAYATKKATLERQSNEGGIVSRGKAKASLAALLKEDPLPLRRAKITTEAAERKAEKARAPFKIAREKAEEARAAAEKAREAAEAAVEAAREKLQEAEDYVEEVRKQPGQPYGSFWWIDRELEEKRKYLPKRKQ
eukprot:TRINITY_DN1336_c0_g1_i1.p1 TRINITY_DN1336_c0_g1~~TRINITY_DN1336_c0_g1_i1.p1  ORF type:complete len:301 (-),score=116.21 TRINITY_DN1336_c0_g1_i1:103-1005(-)